MTKTIDVIKKCITTDNCVTRSVYKDIISNRLKCSRKFVEYMFL